MKMIRVLFFSVLALGLIACTGIFILFQTFDTDQYLPQIARKASLVLGRPVSIGHVGLGLSSQGITLDVGPLTVADDPGFTTEPFVSIDRVRIKVDMRALVLHHQLRIKKIIVQSPQVHFIRSQDGNFNARSIGRSNGVLAGPKGETVPEAVPGPGAVASPPPAEAGSDAVKRSLRTDATTLKAIVIQDAAISFIDQNQAFPLDIWLSDINATLHGSSLSQPFPVSFNACFYNNVPNVHFNASVFFELSKRSVQISDLKLYMDFSHLDIEQLKDVSPRMQDNTVFNHTAGVVQLNLSHLEMGVAEDFKADGEISITDGTIKDFNIVKTILSQTLANFGGMGINVDNLLGGPLNGAMSAKDTTIKMARAKFSLHDRSVNIDDSLVQTNIFEFTAKGSIDPALELDMQTMLHLNDDVSADLVDRFKGFKYLMDDSQRIAIGASLKGTIPHLKYKPNKDFRKKSQRALMEEGGNILGVLLGSGQNSTDPPDASSKSSAKRLKKSLTQIFKNFLQ